MGIYFRNISMINLLNGENTAKTTTRNNILPKLHHTMLYQVYLILYGNWLHILVVHVLCT